jgi:hypothetical protein
VATEKGKIPNLADDGKRGGGGCGVVLVFGVVCAGGVLVGV